MVKAIDRCRRNNASIVATARKQAFGLFEFLRKWRVAILPKLQRGTS